MKVQAAVTNGAGASFCIEEVELAPPGREEILVRIQAVGICHTDEAARQQHLPIPLPAVLGHEGAGVVEAVGDCVSGISVGNHVALTFASCGKCIPCISGRPYGCENMLAVNFSGVMVDGTTRLSRKGSPLSCFFSQSSFASYVVVHQNSAVKIKEDVDFAVAAPMGCGVQTGAGIVLNCLRPSFGSSIAIFGCGTVGMCAIMAAAIAGCGTIIAVGGNPHSLALARQLGATHSVNRKETDHLPGVLREIAGNGLDYVVETSGAERMFKDGLGSLSFMGTLVAAGAGAMSLHTGLELGARRILGVTEGNSVPKVFLPKLLEYYRKGLFPVDRLLRRYPFAHINEAFDDTLHGRAIKAVLLL